MRRTIATLGIVGTLMVGVYSLRSTSPAPADKNSITTATKGVKHEARNQRSRSTKVQRTRSREDERSSDESDEIESLASIYQDQEAESVESQSGAESDRSAVTEEELNSQVEKPSSPIPGVKVSAWVSSHKNAIPREVPDPAVGAGLRYFLNCVELKKKGVSPLNGKDCDALITDRRYKN